MALFETAANTSRQTASALKRQLRGMLSYITKEATSVGEMGRYSDIMWRGAISPNGVCPRLSESNPNYIGETARRAVLDMKNIFQRLTPEHITSEYLRNR